MATHLAAIAHGKGPLKVEERPTPAPGPKELLIEVNSIAINPVDAHQRDRGIFVKAYPAVFGSDIAGTVISSGSSVPSDAPKPGSRIAGFASAFYQQGSPNYGAFQKKLLIPAANVVLLPDNISYNEGALLPMSVETGWAGFYVNGIARDTKYTPADKKGFLVWSGATSVASSVVQIAKSMGYYVYVTASAKHHQYLKTIGATHTFDYHDADVAESIAKAAKADGVTINEAYLGQGEIKPVLETLKLSKGPGPANIAHAPRVPEDAPKEEGFPIRFVMPPTADEALDEHFHFVFGVWLKDKLAKGEYIPSPAIKIIPGGLEGVDKAIDEILSGTVSGEKLVLEI